MNMKKTTLATAILLSLTLAGCGSSDDTTAAVIEYVTELTTEQTTSLEEAGLSAEEIAVIIVGNMTQSEVDAAVAAAIAEATGVSVSYSALIIDESTSNAYIRHNVDSAAQAEGSLSVNIKVNPAEPKLSYISLFPSSSTSVSNAVLDLKMGSNAGSDYPDTSDDMVSLHSRQDKVNNELNDTDLGIEIGAEWVNVTLAWSQSAGTVEITVSDLDGTEIGSTTTDMYNVGAVAKIAFKNADESGVSATTTPYYIDDVVVADADGNATFEESFDTLTAIADNWDTVSGTPEISADENTTEGTETGVIEYQDVLTDDQETRLLEAGVTDTSGIIVGEMTADEVEAAVVAAIEAATAPAVDNKAAQVIDTLGSATTDKDTGELRIKLADEIDSFAAIEEGQISARILIQEDADTTVVVGDDGKSSGGESIKDTGYISLYAAGTSTNQLHADIIFSSGSIKYRTITMNEDAATMASLPYLDDKGVATADRSEADDVQVDSGIDYTVGAPMDVVVTWDALGSKVSLDGGSTFSDNFVGQDLGGITYVSFKIADTSSVSTSEFLVDDIVIEDDGAEVFAQDFEDETVGTDLGTVYNSSSSEASVVAASLED